MSLGISATGWQDMSSGYAASRARRYNSNYVNAGYQSGYVRNTQTNNNYMSDNTCTDGKDDGKIGFFGALGSVVKGVFKGAVNAVKGAFTDENGNFSLWKTIKTVAIGAACIAFPAVGFAVSCIGLAAGAIKVAKGVSNAVSAKTDAEAKDAWEAVGDGGLTVAASYVGAKASYGAIIKTAGSASKIAAMKEAGTWENATRLQKAAALGKDMVTSTKNQYGNLKGAFAGRFTKAGKKAAQAEAAKINELRAKTANINGAPTAEEAAALRELEIRTGEAGNQYAIKLANKQTKSSTTFGSVTNKAKASYESMRNSLKNKSLSDFKIKNIKSRLSAKGGKILDFLTTEEGTYAAAVRKYGYNNVAEVLEVAGAYLKTNDTI